MTVALFIALSICYEHLPASTVELVNTASATLVLASALGASGSPSVLRYPDLAFYHI